VVVQAEDGEDRLYFVVETKGDLLNGALRPIESRKIDCGEAHFEALAVEESPAQYVVDRTVDGLLSRI
jgi:type III restriction enzyme